MLPRNIREQVIARDGCRCRYCGIAVVEKFNYPYKRPIPNHMAGVGLLTIDHIRPRSKGGHDTLDNLCVACYECNTKKSNFHMEYVTRRRNRHRARKYRFSD